MGTVHPSDPTLSDVVGADRRVRPGSKAANIEQGGHHPEGTRSAHTGVHAMAWSSFETALGETVDEAALEDEEDGDDGEDHHHRGGAGEGPVAAEAGLEIVVAGDDGEEFLLGEEDGGEEELIPDR